MPAPLPTPTVPQPSALPAPRPRPTLRARLRHALAFEFCDLGTLDLGDPADFDMEVEALFSRGGHRPTA